ncbi:MAG: TonB family protein [Deltaproteobacteria bacterium]|nr:TonB family protein [Deltaproteobacteria bacterium]
MAPRKTGSNRLHLTPSLCVALLAHGVLLGLLSFGIYNHVQETRALGQPGASFISVSLVDTENHVVILSEAKNPAEHRDPSAKPQDDKYNSGGNGGEGGDSEIMRQIRSKIERAKFYPLTAKRQGIEGSPVVEFKIKKDGSIEYVRLKQTSGSDMLDTVAQQTVHQAAPYPFYPDPIAIGLHYALANH